MCPTHQNSQRTSTSQSSLAPEDDDLVMRADDTVVVSAGDEAAGAGAGAFATPSKLLSECGERCKAECQSLREVCAQMRSAGWMHDWSKSVVRRQVVSLGGAVRVEK